MGADEVLLGGSSAVAALSAASASSLVCSGRRSRKMPDSVMITSMRGTAQRFQRDQVRAAKPPEPVEPRHRPDQRQRLRDRAAIGLDVVGPPEHQRDAARQALVRVQKHLRLFRALAAGKFRRHAERIEGVDVAPRGQDIGRPDQIAARHRRGEPARERVQHPRDLEIALQQAIDPRPRLGIGIGHQVEIIGAGGVAHRLAQHVQTFGDQRILGLQQPQPQRVRVLPVHVHRLRLFGDQRLELVTLGGGGAPCRASGSGCLSAPTAPCKAPRPQAAASDG